jgi:hypothetical protein
VLRTGSQGRFRPGTGKGQSASFNFLPPMHRTITSNLRLPIRALSAFLIATTPFWGMPGNASAQADGIEQGGFAQTLGTIANATPPVKKVIAFFVVSAFDVAKYNYRTGHPTRVLEPVALAVISAVLLFGPTIYVPTGITFLGGSVEKEAGLGFGSADDTVGWVGTFDATTGKAINTNFILFQPPPGARVDKCTGLALRGKTLFVAFQLRGPGPVKHGVIGKYDARTGAPIDANFITELNQPSGLAVLADSLFVANLGSNSSNGTIGKYDAKTGTPIDANFITGLSDPGGIALFGKTLLVAESFKNTVGKYDVKTGSLINANFITELSHPIALGLLGNTLLVANFFSGTVGKYDAKTGTPIDADFITGLTDPISIAVGATQDQQP